ncbi:double-stranded RNA-binding protein Staufen [Biomphalaria pfeifferi]|uniref:Double-stranded RNA-binding protein Staufen n=1 Tax=Biomphalaria pfeifferi TaxID=112525 RepID=A0AAD8C679_BIOPF|nr:double-stranded RNA-binding protein Staufen [Biomphalaria pfeifferi]
MSHNHLMSSQQQHSMMNSNNTGVQQRNVIAQRSSQTSSQPKSTFQVQTVPITQLSHLQQQQQLINTYHSQKQMSPDLSTMNPMAIQNGNFQTLSGASLHANIESSIQHQFHQSQQQQAQIQPSVQQHIYQQASVTHQNQQGTHHMHQSMQHMLQQPQIPQHVSTNFTQQQHIQQIQQRNISQLQKQQIQPKQILQHPSHLTKNVSSLAQQSSQPQSSHLQTQQSTKVTVTNGQSGTVEAKKETNEKSEVKLPEKPEKNNATEMLGLANTKEKTPMCLINELARFNKISHQYTLVDEQGPAHKKTFYVKLKLGEEEYPASGESIKKAQHAAAAIALDSTKYPQPPPKPARFCSSNSVDSGDENITPTVELNALAMKRGEAAVYKAIEPQQPPYFQPGMDYRGLYSQRYHQYMRAPRDPRYRGGGVLWPLRCQYPRFNRAFYVSLRVGHREFIGDGPTRQAARHNAAQKALRILKNLPVQNEPKKEEPAVVETNDSLKSEISLVHEIALRRNMPVSFEVIREAGPPHQKNFITRCIVGDKITEGEGNSKKTSKKKAAELMLEELRKLPPIPAPAYPRPKSKIQLNKKKNRNIIKSELQQQKADPNYGVGINPISRLIQIMQAQKKKEPLYTLIAERGLPRRREFIMQVDVEDKTSTGTGPNKKLAKRSAAEAMLQLLGYTKPSPQPAKSSFKNPASGEGHQSNGDKKVKFLESDIATDNVEKPSAVTPTVHQRVPGLLHLPNNKLVINASAVPPSASSQSQAKEPLVNLASILKPNLRPEIQLRELCKALALELEIDDFTKKRPTGTEHITRITVGKEPGQNFHGSSNTLDSSRDMAALDALKVLLVKVKDIHPGGDGPQVKKELLTRSNTAIKKDISK